MNFKISLSVLSKYAKKAGKSETWAGYYLTSNILPMFQVVGNMLQ